MGFRSTFTTEDWDIEWPEWFREKYAETVVFHERGRGSLSSSHECKVYGVWDGLHDDIQRAIDWEDAPNRFVLVYLHECGGITRCQIERNRIAWSEPESWLATDGVTHSYCTGCSDV